MGWAFFTASGSIKTGVANQERNYIPLVFEYDFAVQGGASGAITLTDENGNAQSIPDNAIIMDALLEVVDAPTSAGSATLSLGYTGNTNAFVPSDDYNSGNWNTDVIRVAQFDLPLKMTSLVDVLLTIGGADLTAGRLRLHLKYKEGV